MTDLAAPHAFVLAFVSLGLAFVVGGGVLLLTGSVYGVEGRRRGGLAEFFRQDPGADVVECDGGEVGVRTEDGGLDYLVRGRKGSEAHKAMELIGDSEAAFYDLGAEFRE